MAKILLTFILFPLLLCAKTVEVVADWAITEQDEHLSRIKVLLDKQGDKLAISDLSSYAEFLKKESRKSFKLSDDVKKIVIWNFPKSLKKFDLTKLPKERLVLFMWEPPTVQKQLYNRNIQQFFSRIYTWDDDLVDNKRFFKFYYPVLHPMISDRPAFENKKLCSMIFSNKKSKHPQELYTAREDVIRFFEAKKCDDFEFYGRWWENAGYSTYRGSPPDKTAVLKNYRFCFCYENIHGKKGYVTEKMFDAFTAGCVPIYWGASNIEKYVPENLFIDRRKFKDNEELYLFMKRMSKEEYEGYLSRIEKWLNTEDAKRFSVDHFVKTFMEGI
jgi:hypothetical protein